MRKLQYRAFGGLDVLELVDVEIPIPRAGELLVRVEAAAINPVDWKMRAGQVKILTGWRMPQGQGLEFAGVVERVGRGVSEFAVGDHVFGAAKDCMADYCVAKVGRVAKQPPGVSFVVAATLPCVGTTAASAFRRELVRPGSEVLVHGAAGGIGMFATQMAVRRGARVTAVVSDKGVALAQRWGAADVVNYRATNILAAGRSFDVIIELSDKLSFRAAKAMLKTGGTFVASLPNPAEFVPGLLGNLVSTHKYALMGMRTTTAAFQAVAGEVAAGHVEVVVGRTFALEAFREAYRSAAAGEITGKAVFET